MMRDIYCFDAKNKFHFREAFSVTIITMPLALLHCIASLEWTDLWMKHFRVFFVLCNNRVYSIKLFIDYDESFFLIDVAWEIKRYFQKKKMKNGFNNFRIFTIRYWSNSLLLGWSENWPLKNSRSVLKISHNPIIWEAKWSFFWRRKNSKKLPDWCRRWIWSRERECGCRKARPSWSSASDGAPCPTRTCWMRWRPAANSESS